jgi:hypothetical protein
MDRDLASPALPGLPVEDFPAWEVLDPSTLPHIENDDPAHDAAADEAFWSSALLESRPLLDLDPELLSPAGAIDYLVDLQRAQARLAWLEARALVVAGGHHVHSRDIRVHDPERGRETTITLADERREEIAAALHRSPGVVHDQLVTARLLAGPLAALATGAITTRHARAIADQARRLSTSYASCHQDPAIDTPADIAERSMFDEQCRDLQDLVLPDAVDATAGRTRAQARRAFDLIDSAARERRRQRAMPAVDVHVYAEDDGLAVLLARLPIEQAARVHAAIDARARSTRTGCEATLGQLRVQALLDAVCADHSGPDTTVTAEIQIVIDAASLLGVSDRPGTIVVGPDGPQSVSAQAIRELVDDPDVPSTLRRLVTDPVTSHLLDRGRSSYRVTDAMRAFLAIRDATCRHPGCSRPARACQIDHAIPWDDGGGTDRDNTGHLCARHHQLKTHGGWDIIESKPDGTAIWRSPLGRTYVVEPPPL